MNNQLRYFKRKAENVQKHPSTQKRYNKFVIKQQGNFDNYFLSTLHTQ